jgi:hypothetical protein
MTRTCDDVVVTAPVTIPRLLAERDHDPLRRRDALERLELGEEK